jgi:hypothetical protein
MNKGIVFIAGLFLWLNGFSQNTIEVKPIEKDFNTNGQQFFYTLPKNIIEVSIEYKQTVKVPGPYAEFASKYLNISEGVSTVKESYFEILSSKITTHSVADSSQWHCIQFTSQEHAPLLQVASNGVMLGCNLDYTVNNSEEGFYTSLQPKLEPELIFTDLGVKSFQIEEAITLYRTVETDSLPLKVPYEETQVKPKTTEENAKEAAAFIRKLRKRRLKMLVAQKDEVNPLNGNTVEDATKALQLLENEYISLFIGKSKTNTYIQTFFVEPNSTDAEEQHILGWFSKQNGIEKSRSGVRNKNLQPISLYTNTVSPVPGVNKENTITKGKETLPVKFGIFYRMPADISYALNVSGKTILQGRTTIAQKGNIVPLPSIYLKNRAFGMEFCPKYGSLKRIVAGKFKSEPED